MPIQRKSFHLNRKLAKKSYNIRISFFVKSKTFFRFFIHSNFEGFSTTGTFTPSLGATKGRK